MTPAEFAERALDVPFRARGRTWDGWDCWGLVYLYYREVIGEPVDSYANRYEDPGWTTGSRLGLGALISHHLPEWTRVEEPYRTGDVAVYKVAGQPVHVALVVGPDRALHALSGKGTFVARLSAVEWRNRLEGVYRRGLG